MNWYNAYDEVNGGTYTRETSDYYKMFYVYWIPTSSELAMKAYYVRMDTCAIGSSTIPTSYDSSQGYVNMWGASALAISNSVVYIGGNAGISSD
jgi:hypothetical protein